MLLDFATLSKTLGDMWQTVPEKEKMVCYFLQISLITILWTSSCILIIICDIL